MIIRQAILLIAVVLVLYCSNVIASGFDSRDTVGDQRQKNVRNTSPMPQPVPEKAGRKFVMDKHKRRPYAAIFLGNRPTIASAGMDSTIYFWNFRTQMTERMLLLKKGEQIRSLDYSPTRDVLASGGHNVELWSAKTGRRRRIIEHFDPGKSSVVTDVCFSSDGKLLATASDCLAKVWDVSSGNLRVTMGESDIFCDRIRKVAIALKSRYLVVGYRSGTVKVFSIENGKCLQTYSPIEPGDNLIINAIDVSPNDRDVAVGLTGDVKIIDLVGGTITREIKLHRSISSLDYSPDGRHLAAAANDSIYILDIATGKLLKELDYHGGVIFSVSYSPDGKYLVSSGVDKKVIVWKLASK